MINNRYISTLIHHYFLNILLNTFCKSSEFKNEKYFELSFSSIIKLYVRSILPLQKLSNK